jgi:hypothetical protein
MYDIFYIAKEKDYKFLNLQKKIPLLKLAKYENNIGEGFLSAQKKAMTSFFWVINENLVINDDFDFDYEVPDWDKQYVHVFKQNCGEYGGLYLIPRNYRITKKESDFIFFVNKKDIDILFGEYPPFDRFYIRTAEDYFEAQKACTTSMFYAIPADYKIIDDFKFSIPEWDKKYVHMFKAEDQTSGVINLIPKDYSITQKEAKFNFFVNKKVVEKKISKPNYDRFVIKTPDDYFEAQEKSKTSLFYAIIDDYKILDSFEFAVPEYDKKFVHVFKDNDGNYKGVYLIPKDYPITKKEAKFNFFVNKKEIDIVASRISYDQFIVYNPDEFYIAQENSNTSMFYAIDKDYEPIIDFDYIVPDYDKEYVNVFKNDSDEYGGVFIVPKNYHIIKNEAKHGFFVNKKEIDIVASKLKFDIVFVSYNEPNADENWKKIKERFPKANRVHGVKGIHQAHIEAAKLCQTTMFWVVDGDAIIEPDFDFYIKVPKWDRDAVHVFRSKNPINDLIYGYGGVKLLPRELVLNMDVNSVDMTTSISKKFIMVDEVSNITNFNTDPFSTWKSAFRECVKLSSKVIDGQIDDQTQERLDIWCTVGADRPFGEYAIKGAIAGKEFGTSNLDNKEMLKKINDWEWLENEFRR